MSGVVLENARIWTPEDAVARPLSFEAGRVATTAAGALRLDLSGHAVLPGLINAHDHLPLNCVPPLPHASPFANSYEWIDAFEDYRPTAAVATAVAIPVATRHWHGALKNVLAGVTMVAHHDPLHAAHDDPDFPVGVVREFGWSHSLGLGMPRGERPPRYGPPVVDSFLATPSDKPWIIHLAEGIDDVAARELSCLDALGCLSPSTVLVHGAGLSSCDVDRIAAAGAAVVWCPSSNIELFGRTLDPRALAAAGCLALGSDSRLTGAGDLLEELRIAAANSDLSPHRLVRLVTADAARILRLASRGSLAEGNHADCVILRVAGDVDAALLATARASIRAVVRAGVPVVADPDFAPWFAHADIATAAVRLDGRPKLVARALMRPDAVALEPGLAGDA